MRKVWYAPSIVGNGLLWLVGAALQIGGWVNDTIAYILLGIAFLWSIATFLHWWRERTRVRNQKQVVEERVGPKLAQVVTGILNKIHERDLKLKNSAKKQYLVLFNLKDFRELWDNYAIMRSRETYKSIKKELGRKKLRKDKFQRRDQIDDLHQRLLPITKQEEWTLEELIRLTSFLEQFPKTQNDTYQGIGKRRETDRRWQTSFRLLNNLRIEHAQVFSNKELAHMLDEYIDSSKVAVTIIMFIELLEIFVPSDVMPTEYLESGIEDASIKIGTHMTKLLEDISNKITELERQ